MDKPKSLTMREYLVRTLAVKMMVSEKVIDAVVAHQFQEANTALLSNDTIEISGFGKFIFNTKKAHKTMELYYSKERKFKEMLQNPNISEAKRNSVENKLRNNDFVIEQLKSKLNDKPEANIRGLEEQPNSPFPSEGDD
jgi:nucleoid DNA-binding protein